MRAAVTEEHLTAADLYGERRGPKKDKIERDEARLESAEGT